MDGNLTSAATTPPHSVPTEDGGGGLPSPKPLLSDAGWARYSEQILNEIEQMLAQGGVPSESAGAPSGGQSEAGGQPGVAGQPPEGGEDIFSMLGVEKEEIPQGQPEVPSPPPSPQQPDWMTAAAREALGNALRLQILARTNPQQFWEEFYKLDPQAASGAMQAISARLGLAGQGTAASPSPAGGAAGGAAGVAEVVSHLLGSHAGSTDRQKELEEISKIEDPVERLEKFMAVLADQVRATDEAQRRRDAVLLYALGQLANRGEEQWNRALAISSANRLRAELQQVGRELMNYAEQFEGRMKRELGDLDQKIKTWVKRAGLNPDGNQERQRGLEAWIREVLGTQYRNVVDDFHLAVQSLDDQRIEKAKKRLETAIVETLDKIRRSIGASSVMSAQPTGGSLTPQEQKALDEALRVRKAAEQMSPKLLSPEEYGIEFF